MNNKSKSRNNIEVLEPLLLMSASAIDAEPIEIACGGEDFAWTAQAPEDTADNTGGEQWQEFGGGRDENGESVARFDGNRADYSATDQGFGIFAIRCGNDNSTEFVTDVSEIEFLDGTFGIDDLTADPSIESAPEPLVESVGDPLTVETANEQSVAAEVFADELDEPYSVVPDDGTLFLTDFDDSDNNTIVTSSVEELTEEAWFPAGNTEGNDVVQAFFDAADVVEVDISAKTDVTDVVVADEAPVESTDVALEERVEVDPPVEFTASILDEIVESELIEATVAEELSVVALPEAQEDTLMVPVLIANETVNEAAEMWNCEFMVEPINHAPDGQDDLVIAAQDNSVSGSVAGNDSDPDGDTLTFYVEEGPQNGSIEFGTDGSYTYTPDPGFSGQDTFTYEVSDGNGGTDIAEACVAIIAIPECPVDPQDNQDPDAQDDAAITTQGIVFSGSVAGNDADPDGDNLSFYIEEGPQNGSIEFATDGSYTYTPDPGFSGQDTFTYEVSDGNGGTDIAEVCLTIVPGEECAVVEPPDNQGPDGQDDATTTTQDTAISGSVAGNDSDPDGEALGFYVEEGPQNGSIEFATDGSYTYSPDPGFSGQDTFTYEVSDGNGGTDIATVNITVDPAPNQNPDAIKDSNTTEYNTAVEGTVLCNDVDPDSDSLSAALTTPPQNGTVTLTDDGHYTYTPNPGFSGTDTFTYEVSDGNGGSDTAEVCIEVGSAPNNDVDAIDDQYSTDQDQSVDGNVLTNDVDPDGDQLTASPMTDVLTSSGGLVSLHEDGSFVYVPADGFTGVDTFTYSANDGNGSTASATVTITVNDVPPPPQDDVFTGDNATEIQGNVTTNDGGDTTETEITIVDAPTNGTLTIDPDGTFRYMADDGFSGDDTFTYSLYRCGVVAGSSTVRMVVAEVTYDTTYVSAGNNGRVWGDPHFEGDDGGLYDVQGEAGHIYNILSDNDLQVNSLFIPWEGHEGSAMIGQIGATVGTDLVLADETGTFINGVAVQAGEVITLADGQIEYDGEYTTVTTAEYKLEFHRREGWYDMKLEAINPFSDNVAPHGLWGLTVDGDTEARDGEFFKTHGWDYTLQGGGALDTVDANGDVVLSETGDRSAYKLYEAANLFSTDALNSEGDSFFRFSARQGTGLTPVV